MDGVLRGLFILIKRVLQDELPLGFCAHGRACCAVCPDLVHSLGVEGVGTTPPFLFQTECFPALALQGPLGCGLGAPGAERRVPSAG